MTALLDWSTLCVWHAVPTLYLCGLIWFVQVAHYPLFPAVGAAHIVAYERRYTPRVTAVVLPAMLAEAVLAVWLWTVAPASAGPWPLLGLLLLATVWASTFLLQVPCHRTLAQRADPVAMRRLVQSNWLRTAAWTGRGAIAVRLLSPC